MMRGEHFRLVVMGKFMRVADIRIWVRMQFHITDVV